MDDDGLILAELLCARLVHDLSGPVGAVANGAELLGEEGGGGEIAGEAVELLAGSAAAAVARLRFLRLALGSPGAAPKPAELRKLAIDYFSEGVAGADGVKLDWPASLDAALANLPARLIANLLMLGRDCLPRGGVLRIAAPPAGAVFALAAEGNQAAPNDAAHALAADSPRGLSPRGAQGYLTARLAQAAGLVVIVAVEPGRVRVMLQKD